MKTPNERFAACRGFHWVPGMVSEPDSKGRTWRRVADTRVRFVQESGRVYRDAGGDHSLLLPDIADPGTEGCAMYMLREAGFDYAEMRTVITTEGPRYHVIYCPDPVSHWNRWPRADEVDGSHASRPEALAAAMESAP